jgi:hypothetical protein
MLISSEVLFIVKRKPINDVYNCLYTCMNDDVIISFFYSKLKMREKINCLIKAQKRTIISMSFFMLNILDFSHVYQTMYLYK